MDVSNCSVWMQVSLQAERADKVRLGWLNAKESARLGKNIQQGTSTVHRQSHQVHASLTQPLDTNTLPKR